MMDDILSLFDEPNLVGTEAEVEKNSGPVKTPPGKQLSVQLKRCDKVYQIRHKTPYTKQVKTEETLTEKPLRYAEEKKLKKKIKSFKCGHCHLMFSSNTELELHHHRNRISSLKSLEYRTSCNICFCKTTFVDENLKINHLEKIKGIKYVCQICNTMLSSLCLYVCHQKNHGLPFIEVDVRLLYELEPSEKGVKQFCAEERKKPQETFRKPRQKIYTQKNVFICVECYDEFETKESLENHKVSEHPDVDFSAHEEQGPKAPVNKYYSNVALCCAFCDAEFTHTTPFKQHLFTKHGVNKKKTYCFKCMGMFDTKEDCREHKKDMAHPAKCGQCDLILRTVCNVAQHRRVHPDTNLQI